MPLPRNRPRTVKRRKFPSVQNPVKRVLYPSHPVKIVESKYPIVKIKFIQMRNTNLQILVKLGALMKRNLEKVKRRKKDRELQASQVSRLVRAIPGLLAKPQVRYTVLETAHRVHQPKCQPSGHLPLNGMRTLGVEEWTLVAERMYGNPGTM